MYLKGRPITMFIPKDQVDSYCLEARADPPGNKLKLDWVYPFRCSFPLLLWRELAGIIISKVIQGGEEGEGGIQLFLFNAVIAGS